MEISDFTIRLILMVLPGALAALCVETLTVHRRWTMFRFILYSIMLSMVSYIVYQSSICIKDGIIYVGDIIKRTPGAMYRQDTLTFWAAILNKNVQVSFMELLNTCLFGIVSGLFVTKMVQDKWVHKLARRYKISNKFGDENLYTRFLNSKEVDWVWVRDRRTDLIYEGDVQAFSETDGMREIVLSDVKIYNSKKPENFYEVPYIYLTFSQNEFIIELPSTKIKEEKQNGSATTN